MKRTLLVAALVVASVGAHAQTKKQLVDKILAAQQPAIENVARSIAERPAVQMMQAAGSALQQLPADKREATGKQIEADVRKFVDEAVPVLRDRANKLAPSTLGAQLEEKFTDDELKQLLAWLESPVNKKYQQLMPEIQNGFTQKLIADAAPVLDPKLQALQNKVRSTLGIPQPAATDASKPAGKASGAK
ncbi:DUF2059 domain-containing protein [Aquincola tertiaricarbonis]|uniref:DUF2059 domain-containing protein n=1 Tax=Aquincola tertiaricarbonis TaxID=391953 RepID=A0ABY4SH14_AQUTE|nr:DUF2059 domain-containing protein [Aquincola tertiaricarbonis]URI11417.1 DUF2059 domain-containing protein [Aquincola tertiaricarbonis]